MAEAKKGKLAVVLVRGLIGLEDDKLRTLHMLRLLKKHVCGIYADTPAMRGMITKVESLVTWGEVSDATLKTLEEKRRRSKAKDDDPSPHYFMQPPKGGFERKGVKVPFKKGGVLGYRGDKMDLLLARMM